MADYALTAGAFCRPYRSPWGAQHTMTYTPISTHSIYLGQVVTLNWTGSTSAGQIVGSTAPNFFQGVGIAAISSTYVSSATAPTAMIPVWEANPLCEFQARSINGTLQSTCLGQHRKLMWDSTNNISVVDLSASTASDWRVVVTGLVDAVGDSGGWVSFRFLPHLTENIASSVAVTSTTPILAFYS